MSTRVFTLGLTGGIGSGKTTIANMFADLGIQLVDTDQLAHQLTAPKGSAIPAIVATFGEQMLLSNGALDRDQMRELIFSDPEQKLRLEQILHPLIRQETEAALQQASSAYVIGVVPLLVESPTWTSRFDRILVVDCHEATQIARVVARSGLSEERVRSIMANQATRETRLSHADDVIVNEGDLTQIRQQVGLLHQKYLRLANSVQ